MTFKLATIQLLQTLLRPVNWINGGNRDAARNSYRDTLQKEVSRITSCAFFQDMLFDASVHRVKKFILHTNFPGHYDFNM